MAGNSGAYQIPRSDWLFSQIRSCGAEMGASVAACVDYRSGSVTQAAQADQSFGTCINSFFNDPVLPAARISPVQTSAKLRWSNSCTRSATS